MFILERQDIAEALIDSAIMDYRLDKLFLSTKTIKDRVTRKGFIVLRLTSDFAG